MTVAAEERRTRAEVEVMGLHDLSSRFTRRYDYMIDMSESKKHKVTAMFDGKISQKVVREST